MLHTLDFHYFLQRMEGICRPGSPTARKILPDFEKIFTALPATGPENRGSESLQLSGQPPAGPIETRALILELEKSGDLAFMQGRLPQSLAVITAALELTEKVSDEIRAAELKFKAGKINAELGHWEMAQLLFTDCLAIFTRAGNSPGLARIRVERARIEFKKGRYVQAQAILEELLAPAQQALNYALIASICLQLGALYQILNSPKFALAYFEEALRAAQMNLAPRETAEAYFQLGRFYQSHQDPENTEAHFLIAKQLCAEHDLLHPLGFIWLNEVSQALELENFAVLPAALEKALGNFIQSQNQFGLAGCMQFLAKLTAKVGDWETSQKLFELSIEMFQNFEIPYDLALCCVNYADELLERTQIHSALRHYQMAATLFRELKLDNFALNLEEEMAELSRFAEETNPARSWFLQ